MTLARVFIGGTGRSGTSILYEALGCHSDIHKLPKEMRFIIDPDGLMDLVNALTVRFSPTQAREAVFKFERLMRVYLAVPESKPYPTFSFPAWLGNEHYWHTLEHFLGQLTVLAFEGSDWPVEPMPWNRGRLVGLAERIRDWKLQLQGKSLEPPQLRLPQKPLRVIKYYSDRSELTALAAQFVDELFLYSTKQEGKDTWCEKTPNNLLHIDFLWELFPDALFIHMKRDPRGVVHSMMRKPWAPNDVEGACRFLSTVYDRWFDLREQVNFADRRFLEFKLEQLGEAPDEVLNEIVDTLGVPYDFTDLPSISLKKANYWHQTMPRDEIGLVNEMLSSYIERMGYEV